ncbi:MAG: hypothetical protein AAGC86_08755 [Pseudomonadota bacterium]
MDPILLLAGLVTIILTLSIGAGLRSWWHRRSGAAPRDARSMGPFRGKKPAGASGLRALQEAGRARARARNKASIGSRNESTETIGKAHRDRLKRKSSGGPWS